MNQDPFCSFLIRAKQHTYASGQGYTTSSRPNSHDLSYTEGNLTYIDTYLGGFHFIGEEAVWKSDVPIWGMNYYGKMLVDEVPQGFGEFLKEALLQSPAEAPYRGPGQHRSDSFVYHCEWKGSLERFEGWEEIMYQDASIYRLVFHGGEIRD
jgi:hypothetical protein